MARFAFKVYPESLTVECECGTTITAVHLSGGRYHAVHQMNGCDCKAAGEDIIIIHPPIEAETEFEVNVLKT